MRKKLVFLMLLCVVNSIWGDFNENMKFLVLQNPPEWMDQQIDKDFEYFKHNGFSEEAVAKLMQSPGNEHSVRYKIQSQHISYYSNDVSESLQNRRDQIYHALKKLADAVPLPDIDIVFNPLDSAHFNQDSSLAPVLVFSKNRDFYNQVLIPDLDALRNYDGIGKEIEKGSRLHSWKSKKNKAFWRGATTGGAFDTPLWYELPRAALVLISLRYPKLLDAKFTMFVQGAERNEHMLSMHQLKGQNVLQRDSLKYKYLIDVDGNTCSWQRMYWIMLSNSVLFKQVTENIEWYYSNLIPYKNYIPVNKDLSDLVDKIKWAKKNDRKVRIIAKNATQLARNILNEEMIYLYLYRVLVRYSELQNFNHE